MFSATATATTPHAKKDWAGNSSRLRRVEREREHYAKLTEIITLQIFRLDDMAHEYSNETVARK